MPDSLSKLMQQSIRNFELLRSFGTDLKPTLAPYSTFSHTPDPVTIPTLALTSIFNEVNESQELKKFFRKFLESRENGVEIRVNFKNKKELDELGFKFNAVKH
jgi:hypothetical protein